MRNAPFDNSHSTEPRYNTKVVVRETGVPADTFRAWERRYNIPVPHRTATGQRLYSERDIAIIRWLRDRTDEGVTISQAVRLLEQDDGPAENVAQPVAWDTLHEQLVPALLALDGAAAEAALARAFAVYSVDDVCIRLIAPALVTIGEGWHAGTVSIGQEHFATELLRRKLQGLLGVYDVVAGHATIVAACAPGENHDMGLLILALMLVRRGYRVVYLGSDVPIEGLLPIVEKVSADLVCLSTATTRTAPAAKEVARALRRLSNPPRIVVGGAGIAEDADPEGLYTQIDGDAQVAADQIAALIAQRRSGAKES